METGQVNKKTEGKRARSSAYPNYNIERCIEFAGKIFDRGARNVLLDVAAKEMSYSNKKVGPFLSLRAAAKYFGLVEYEGDYISVSENYINVLLEKSEDRKKEFIRQAVLQPALYAKLFDTFGGKQLPTEQDLAVRLSIDKKYGISKDASKDAARVFIESVKYAGLLDENNYLKIPGQHTEVEQAIPPERQITEGKTSSFKEKLPSSLDHYEFTLETGNKVVLALPPKLSTKDKNRLKMLLDLIPDVSDNKMTLTAEANDST
ncbi:MAG: hypothetical protein HZA09_04835 [Nitrospirae bacterium]|nr:hypothetical protein [Nitrospirota bacterium]